MLLNCKLKLPRKSSTVIKPKKPRHSDMKTFRTELKAWRKRTVRQTREPAGKPPKLGDSEEGMDWEAQSRNC